MINPFSEEVRRNPFPLYDQMRRASPVFHAPPPFDMWMVFDYEGVKRVLSDHDLFSSAVPAPPNWFTFLDPPRHTKLRTLISRAMTPRVVAGLEPQIRRLSHELLQAAVDRGEMDLINDYAVPLPMKVIAAMVGIPPSDWQLYRRWSDDVLKLSYTLRGLDDLQAAAAMDAFHKATAEMDAYLAEMLKSRRAAPQEDLLTGLANAEVDGQRLTHAQILGFFQLLLVAGQETTANLISNAVLCLLENPAQLALLQERMDLLPLAIEEVLRYRSPLQWVMRTPQREVELHGETIPPGQLMLVMIGSANRDSRQFADADRFDIRRDPNPHLAFGLGIHFCLGAPLARMEARIALTDLLTRLKGISLTEACWEPRQALHVHGPTRLPIRFET